MESSGPNTALAFAGTPWVLIMRTHSPGWRNRLTRGSQKPVGCKARVGSSPTPGTNAMASKPKPCPRHSALLAYVVGLALGDGSLSNPNGRATCLRITCDLKYPHLIQKIAASIQKLLPWNKVSSVRKWGNALDIQCYSKHWESLLGWRVGKGSKIIQQVSIPDWIEESDKFRIACLRGLLETDGSIYIDRGYPMVMFVNCAEALARGVHRTMVALGFSPHLYYFINNKPRSPVYHVRLSKRVQEFLALVRPEKS